MINGRHVPNYFTQDARIYKESGVKAGDEMRSDQQKHKGRLLHLLIPKRTSLAHRLNLSRGDRFLDLIEAML